MKNRCKNNFKSDRKNNVKKTRSWGSLGSILGRPGAVLRRSWGRLGEIFGLLGAVLGRLGAAPERLHEQILGPPPGAPKKQRFSNQHASNKKKTNNNKMILHHLFIFVNDFKIEF